MSFPIGNNQERHAAHLCGPKETINIHLSRRSPTDVCAHNPSKHISVFIKVPLVILELYPMLGVKESLLFIKDLSVFETLGYECRATHTSRIVL